MAKKTTSTPASGARRPRVPQAPRKLKKGRNPPPPNETARERFLRIAQPRVENAVYGVKLLGNFARGAYEWNERDARLIVSAIREAADQVEAEFNAVLGTKAPSKEAPHFDFERGLQLPKKNS